MARIAAIIGPTPAGSPARNSDTITATVAATICGRLRSAGAIIARKVIGTAKSSGTLSGMARPTVAPR